jgi:hypothetical protein
MMTAEVPIRNPVTNEVLLAKVFLDTGSGKSFVTQTFSKRLKLKSLGEEALNVNTFASAKSKKIVSQMVTCEAMTKKGTLLKLNLLSVPLISGKFVQPAVRRFILNCLPINKMATVPKSREQEFDPDILLGSDYFGSILEGPTIKVRGNNDLVLLPTAFGHVLSGPQNVDPPRGGTRVNCGCVTFPSDPNEQDAILEAVKLSRTPRTDPVGVKRTKSIVPK